MAVFLLVGCDSGSAGPPSPAGGSASAGKRTPSAAEANPPDAKAAAPVPVPAPPPSLIDAESPLQSADLEALGFPAGVRVTRWGANPRSKEFQCLADGHPTILFFGLEEHDSAEAAAAAYKAKRDARAAAGDPPLKDEDRYGQKSYAAGHEVMFLKGNQVVVVRAGPKPETESKPEALEKVLRGVAERLAK